MIATLGGIPHIDWKFKMKNIPEWLQAVVAIALFLAAGTGIYASHQVQMSNLERRLEFVEMQQKQDNTKTMEVLDKLAGSVEKLSVSVARLDERLKALEDKR